MLPHVARTVAWRKSRSCAVCAARGNSSVRAPSPCPAQILFGAQRCAGGAGMCQGVPGCAEWSRM